MAQRPDQFTSVLPHQPGFIMSKFRKKCLLDTSLQPPLPIENTSKITQMATTAFYRTFQAKGKEYEHSKT